MLLFYLMCIAILAAAIFGGIAVVGNIKNSAKAELRDVKLKLSHESNRLNMAEKALIEITRNTGDPTLVAQIALDEISLSERNELNA